MNQRVEHVTIIGGGTAGWLTALILESYLNGKGDKPNVNISLIESPNIPTIGVGESTLRTLVLTMRDLAVDESQFIYRSNASFKLGVQFANWALDGAAKPITFDNNLSLPEPLGR